MIGRLRRLLAQDDDHGERRTGCEERRPGNYEDAGPSAQTSD